MIRTGGALISLLLLVGCAGFSPSREIRVVYFGDEDRGIARAAAAIKASGFSHEDPQGTEARKRNDRNGPYWMHGVSYEIYCADGPHPCHEPAISAALLLGPGTGFTVVMYDAEEDGKDVHGEALSLYHRLVEGLRQEFGADAIAATPN